MTPRKLAFIALIVAALIPSAMLAWQWRSMPQAAVFHDDSIYLVTAKSLAVGDGYRIASFPSTPAQTKYPPLFAAVLSIAWRISPDLPSVLTAVAFLVWAMLPLMVAACWFLYRYHGITEWEAALLCVWIAANPVAVMFGLLVMSELIFTALIVLAVLFADKALAQGPKTAFYAGLIGGAAFLTRSAAVPLLITAPAVFLWKKQPRSAAWFVAGMLPCVAGWQLWSSMNRIAGDDMVTSFYTNYIGYYLADIAGSDLGAMMWGNFSAIVKAVGELVVFDDSITFGTLTLSRLTTAAAVAGSLRLVGNGRFQHFAAFAIVYLLQFVAWDFPPNYRFVLPLLPLIAVAVLTEFSHLLEIVSKAWRKGTGDKAVACVAGILIAAWLGYMVNHIGFGLMTFVPSVMTAHAQIREGQRSAVKWIAENTPADARILSYRDPMLFLETRRQGVSLRNPPNVFKNSDGQEYFQKEVLEQVSRFGITYVLNSATDFHMDAPERMRPAMSKVLSDASRFKPVFKGDGASVYQVVRAGGG
jgi:hypothetical protein